MARLGERRRQETGRSRAPQGAKATSPFEHCDEKLGSGTKRGGSLTTTFDISWIGSKEKHRRASGLFLRASLYSYRGCCLWTTSRRHLAIVFFFRSSPKPPGLVVRAGWRPPPLLLSVCFPAARQARSEERGAARSRLWWSGFLGGACATDCVSLSALLLTTEQHTDMHLSTSAINKRAKKRSDFSAKSHASAGH
jgi:hypothetical protein